MSDDFTIAEFERVLRAEGVTTMRVHWVGSTVFIYASTIDFRCLEVVSSNLTKAFVELLTTVREKKAAS